MRARERRLRAQPARRDAGARASTRDRASDPADRELEQLRRVDVRGLQVVRRSTRRGPSTDGADGLERRARAICARGDVALAAGASILILSDRGASAESRTDSVPARDRRPCIIISFARARACKPGSSSSRASRARCTASRALRLRRGGSPSVSGARDARASSSSSAGTRGHDAEQAQSARRRASRRACSRRCRRWASRRSRRTAARRSSRPSVSIRSSSSGYFTGTASRIGGIGLRELAEESLARHARAFRRRPTRCCPDRALRVAPRRRAPSLEPGHDLARCSTPFARGSAATYEEFARLVNDENARERHAARAASLFRETPARSRSTRSSPRPRS